MLKFVVPVFSLVLFVSELSATNEYLIIGLLIIPTWFILLKSVHLTEMHRTKTYSMILASYLKVIVIGMVAIFLFAFLFKLNNISRLVILLFGFIDLLMLFSVRLAVYRAMKYFRVKGYNSRNIVVVADDSSEEFINKILNNKEWGYILKHIITNSSNLYKKYKDIYF